MKLYPLPNLTTPTTGNCNNWVTSLDSPINYAQINARVDWTLSNTARLMVRYTQDSWTNSAPPVYTNLWGDDAFPAVSSNWDQPSRSAMIQLTNNIGTKSVNTLTFSYSGNAINIDPGDADPGLVGQIHNTIPSIYPLSSKPYGEQTGAPFTWGLSQGYGSVFAIAPFRNHQNLWVLKDDYSAVFGKHLLKAGVLASSNLKSEDTGSGGGFQNSAFWGSAGLNGWNANTGNILSDFLLKDITFGFSETAGNRQMPTKWNDLEFYVADTWKVRPRRHLGLRSALVAALQLLHGRRQDDELRAVALQPGPGQRPLQRPLHSAGHEPLQDRRIPRRDAGTEPHSPEPEVRRARAAPGRRLGCLRDGQDRRAGGPRALLHARADQRRAQLPRRTRPSGPRRAASGISTPIPSRTPAPSA